GRGVGIEKSQPALHAVFEMLATKQSAGKIEGRLADVRDRTRILNMGQPGKIIDLAGRRCRLSGVEPGREIGITFTGIRPGERLREILFAREEPTASIGIQGIVAAKPVSPSLEAMRGWLAALKQGLAREDRSVIFSVLHDAVPDFGEEAA